MKETWKDIKGYEGYYQVSELGRVKSLKRKWRNNNRMLSPCIDGWGYPVVALCKNGKPKTVKVHILMAIEFLGHTPNGYEFVVDHINNIKTDNKLENLQLISNRENTSKDRVGYSSKFIGVSWFKRDRKWQVRIYNNGKNKHLGYFNDELEASKAYQKALKEIIKNK